MHSKIVCSTNLMKKYAVKTLFEGYSPIVSGDSV